MKTHFWRKRVKSSSKNHILLSLGRWSDQAY